jgi:hypothetical protein
VNSQTTCGPDGCAEIHPSLVSHSIYLCPFGGKGCNDQGIIASTSRQDFTYFRTRHFKLQTNCQEQRNNIPSSPFSLHPLRQGMLVKKATAIKANIKGKNNEL